MFQTVLICLNLYAIACRKCSLEFYLEGTIFIILLIISNPSEATILKRVPTLTSLGSALCVQRVVA